MGNAVNTRLSGGGAREFKLFPKVYNKKSNNQSKDKIWLIFCNENLE